MYLGPLGCGNGAVGGEALLAWGLIPVEIAAAFQVLSSPVLFHPCSLTFRSSFRDLVSGSGRFSLGKSQQTLQSVLSSPDFFLLFGCKQLEARNDGSSPSFPHLLCAQHPAQSRQIPDSVSLNGCNCGATLAVQ